MTRFTCTLLAIALSACTAEISGDGEPDAATATVSGSARYTAIDRAEEWVGVMLHYCQAPNHERDYDAACSSTCERMDNPDWDPYRSDCSGFVSWAWALPAPGRVTSQFAPFKTDITYTIAGKDLQPGDAVNNSEHMMLFKEWVIEGTKATFLEEPGCSSSTPYAHEFTAIVSLSGETVDVTSHGTFTAIRYDDAP